MASPINLTGATGSTGTTPSVPPITISINKEQFEAAVQQYLNLSPAKAELTIIKSLNWPSCCVPPALWTTMADVETLIALVASACELAKDAIVKQYDPAGTLGNKIDNEIVLAVAINIVGQSITFGGLFGVLAEHLKNGLLSMLDSIWVDQQPSNWLALAEKILGLSL
jgi:hypothetical protein